MFKTKLNLLIATFGIIVCVGVGICMLQTSQHQVYLQAALKHVTENSDVKITLLDFEKSTTTSIAHTKLEVPMFPNESIIVEHTFVSYPLKTVITSTLYAQDVATKDFLQHIHLPELAMLKVYTTISFLENSAHIELNVNQFTKTIADTHDSLSVDGLHLETFIENLGNDKEMTAEMNFSCEAISLRDNKNIAEILNIKGHSERPMNDTILTDSQAHGSIGSIRLSETANEDMPLCSMKNLTFKQSSVANTHFDTNFECAISAWKIGQSTIEDFILQCSLLDLKTAPLEKLFSELRKAEKQNAVQNYVEDITDTEIRNLIRKSGQDKPKFQITKLQATINQTPIFSSGEVQLIHPNDIVADRGQGSRPTAKCFTAQFKFQTTKAFYKSAGQLAADLVAMSQSQKTDPQVAQQYQQMLQQQAEAMKVFNSSGNDLKCEIRLQNGKTYLNGLQQ